MSQRKPAHKIGYLIRGRVSCFDQNKNAVKPPSPKVGIMMLGIGLVGLMLLSIAVRARRCTV